MAPHRVRTVYMTASFDIDELLEEIKDDELSAEMDVRSLNSRTKNIVAGVIGDIRRGAIADAITALEREFFPKWKNAEDAMAAFEKSKDS